MAALGRMIGNSNQASTMSTHKVNTLNQVTASPGAWHGYDQNGNMTSSGLTGYGYDDENQLTVAAYVSGDWSNGWRTEFTYDGKMRLRRQADYYWTQITPGTTNGYWSIGTDRRFVYDGMLVVQERSSSNVPTVTYTRGPDLSGTLQGAGGIGGMLGRSHGYSTTTGAWSSHYHYHADGNGNITYMVSPIESLGASYKYDPFGNLISSSGPGSSANLYRFSSKMWTGNSALYYYGYRFYNPTLQRWMNADPIQELGGINMHAFVRNHPVGNIDYLGLFDPGKKRSPKPAPPQRPKLPGPKLPPGRCPPPTNPANTCVVVGYVAFCVGYEIGNGPVGDWIIGKILPDPSPDPLPCPDPDPKCGDEAINCTATWAPPDPDEHLGTCTFQCDDGTTWTRTSGAQGCYNTTKDKARKYATQI